MSERASECLYLNMDYLSVPLANNLWALELAIGHTLRPVENPARALQGFWILLQLHFRSDSNKIKQTNKQTNKSIEKISYLVTCALWRKKEAHDHLQHAFHLSECYFGHQVLNMIMLVYHVNFSDYFNQFIAIQLEETKKKHDNICKKAPSLKKLRTFLWELKNSVNDLKKKKGKSRILTSSKRFFSVPDRLFFQLSAHWPFPQTIFSKRDHILK